jgi:recombination protein RecA
MGPMMNSTSELRNRVEAVLEKRIPRALTPSERPVPEMISTGITAIDSLTGGVPLGCLTEICGPKSSGRTSVLLTLMGECMRHDETCALIDASDAFDPQSAASAGVDLARLLWVRCGSSSPRRHGGTKKNKSDSRSFNSVGIKLSDSPKEYSQVEQALKITDLLLQAGGFGLVILDLADIPIQAARRIPLTTWFRFRRAVENTSTAFVVVEQQPNAKSCASLVLDFAPQQAAWSEAVEAADTTVSTHFGVSGIPSNNEVAFRVTAEGIAIPFDKPTASSFEMPQRWIIPRARLLNTTHAHFQVTRSRGISSSKKLPVRSEFAIPDTVVPEIPITACALSVQ